MGLAERRVERRIVSGRWPDPKNGDPLPEGNTVTPGLVVCTDRFFTVNTATRGPMIISALLTLAGFGKEADKIDLAVFEQEREALANEMRENGLFGEHPLVATQVLREQVSRAQGSIEGSLLLGFSGQYQSRTDNASRILFAWQTGQGRIIFSEVPLERVEILLRDGENPTVEFEFDASRLLYTPVSHGLAVVRRSYGHPNGYIKQALARVTFTAETPDQLGQFLVTANKSLPAT